MCSEICIVYEVQINYVLYNYVSTLQKFCTSGASIAIGVYEGIFTYSNGYTINIVVECIPAGHVYN